MKKLASLFIIGMILSGCGGADSTNDNSQLNGKWLSSQCLSIGIDFSGKINSYKMLMEFDNGKISNKLNEYSDSDCADFVATVNDGLFGHLNVSYTIGNNITILSGKPVTQIDFVDDRGNSLPDIYQLNETSAVLYFGLKQSSDMVQCPSDTSSPVPELSCWTNRPVEIDSSHYFSKI